MFDDEPCDECGWENCACPHRNTDDPDYQGWLWLADA
jgi:hypothetical protein